MRLMFLCVWCTVGGMLIDWSDEFDAWFAAVEAKAGTVAYYTRVLPYVLDALVLLGSLDAAPTDDDASLKRVLDSKRYVVWRTSHPYAKGVAIRLIVWFTDRNGEPMALVVFGGDKAKAGNAWYYGIGAKADAIIDRWLAARRMEGQGHE